ncbi:hypothetical protein V6N11_000729 [Hibiscus sabdariffa]|uniref:Uncharacterized protein n=1 Tax=Hibiscus sabdariffa TaxID=183260 RepID=A0ABR2RYB9_9ROSI
MSAMYTHLAVLSDTQYLCAHLVVLSNTQSSTAAEALRPSRHRDVYPFKYPDLGSEINLRIGVEDDRTCPASERSIREGWNARVWADRSNRSGQRYHTLVGFEFGARPNVS